MNEKIKMRILHLIDLGERYEDSFELKEIIDQHSNAREFYENLLKSEENLTSFYGSIDHKKISERFDQIIEEGLNPKQNKVSWLKPAAGLAIAAGFLIFGLNFLLTPLESIKSTPPIQIVELENEIFIEEEINFRKEIFVSGAEITTLWSTAINLASELGVDKYQVMYALYEGNKESFINNDINSPRADRNYSLDMSIIETVDINFASEEVKRHIYCRC
tara:strand:- start:360 stop:1016 length:657 start_codon:yes stop_codon:yes gene_type:complete